MLSTECANICINPLPIVGLRWSEFYVYIKGTFNHGLVFQLGNLKLEGYCDADYAGCPTDGHSIGGYCMYLGYNPISWSAKWQSTVSRFNTEFECRQLALTTVALTTAEVSWLRFLFKDLRIFLCDAPLIWCDNISSISLASNPVFHAQTKHLQVDYHYVREKSCSQRTRCSMHSYIWSSRMYLYKRSYCSHISTITR